MKPLTAEDVMVYGMTETDRFLSDDWDNVDPDLQREVAKSLAADIDARIDNEFWMPAVTAQSSERERKRFRTIPED